MGIVLQALREEFEKGNQRATSVDEVWHNNFEKFLMALVDRRERRVMEWLHENTVEYETDGDAEATI